MKVTRLFTGNNEIPHVRNFMPNTIIAQTIVMASSPLDAHNISNRLNIRKIKMFGNTHNVIEWVMIFEFINLDRYESRDI